MIMETVNNLMDELIAQIIPIYTNKNPDPETGERDCPIKVMHKEGKRYLMKAKLELILRQYAASIEDKEE